MARRRKPAETRLYLRGRVWWTWGYDGSGKRWDASTKQRDRTAAERVALRFAVEKADQTHATRPLALETAVGKLIDHMELQKRSEVTVEIALSKAGHLTRLLGAKRNIAALTEADTLAYWRARQSEADPSPHSVQKELRILCQALRLCTRLKLCTPVTEPRYLMPSELSQTKVYIPRDRWLPRTPRDEYAELLLQLSSERRDYIVALCFTGVRLGELYKLHASHVNVAQAEIDVPGTKTAKSDRTVPLADDALAVLKRRAKARPTGPLFDDWGKLHRDVRSACKRAGIAPVSPNDMRRTFCSWLAIKGVPMLTASRLLGHASTKMVEQVYAQLDSGALRAGVDVLNEKKPVKRQKAKP